MCDLYSETKGQAAIRGLFRVLHDRTGNLPPIFPDQIAPIVHSTKNGDRELVPRRDHSTSFSKSTTRAPPAAVPA
jgi:hypothetical protein